MPEFLVGAWSLVSGRLLGLGTLAYAVATGLHAKRGFRERLPDRWSSLGTTATLVALAALLWSVGPQALPAPFGATLLLAMAGIAVGVLLYTVLRLQRLVDLLQAALPAPAVQLGLEARRKTPHLLLGLVLLFHAGLGRLLLTGFSAVGVGEPGEWRLNLQAARDASLAEGGHVLALWFCLFLLYGILPIELLRLSAPDSPFPFKRTILSRLRSSEAGLLGAHVHLSAGLGVAWLAAAPDPKAWATGVPLCLAILAVTVFADSAAALFGRRWGRRKWRHNPAKSWLGSGAGTAVAFLAALPFVGAPLAAAAAGVFLAVDLLAPVPLPISDNLLNPLGLAAVLVPLRAHVTPLLPWL